MLVIVWSSGNEGYPYAVNVWYTSVVGDGAMMCFGNSTYAHKYSTVVVWGLLGTHW